MPETSFTAAALMTWGPVGLWIAVGWTVTAAALGVGFGRATKLGETEEERRLKALDEAREAYAQALARKDTRGMRAALIDCKAARVAQLAAELAFATAQKTPPV